MIIDQKPDPIAFPEPQTMEDQYASAVDAGEAPAPPPYPQDSGQENGHAHPDEKPRPEPQPQATDARPPALPARTPRSTSSDDSYVRDPHKLVAYLVPFPKPLLKNVPREEVPDRFLVYTPPPPPLMKPAEGEKEARRHMLQRKWQAEVREAKTSRAKAASWKGVKSKATRGIDWAIGRTTTSGLDFLNRMGDDDKGQKKDKDKDVKEEDGASVPAQGEEGSNGAADADADGDGKAKAEEKAELTELVLVYPSTYHDSPDGMRKEFVDSMMRTKSKAEKDTILATGLLPVAFAIDVLAVIIWPFGGLAEIDSVWAYASFRGAKVARSTTKRLEASEGASHPRPAPRY